MTLTQLDLKLPFDCILSISEWIISPRGRAMLLMALMALLALLLLVVVIEKEEEEEDVEVVVGETAEGEEEEEVAAAKEPGPSEDCTPWLTTVLYRGCCWAEEEAEAEEVCEGEVEADLAAAAAAAFAASFFSSFSTSGGIGEMICPISCCFPLLLPFEVEDVGEVVSLMRIAGGLSGLPDLVDLEEEEVVVEGVDTFQGSLVGWWW